MINIISYEPKHSLTLYCSFLLSNAASGTAPSVLDVASAQAGNLLLDSKSGWIPQMDKTIGQSGIVKAVDHQSNMVLVQFYNPELATLIEWWYPLKTLEKYDKSSSR